MTGYTPTPWRVFTNPDGTKLVGIGARDGQGILDCGFGVWAWNYPEGIANANLVVEAVNNHADLLNKLEHATRLINDGSDTLVKLMNAESRIETLEAALREIGIAAEGPVSYSRQYLADKVAEIARAAINNSEAGK